MWCAMICRALLVSVLFAITATYAVADECALKQYASLDIAVGEQGVLVPVTIEHRTQAFLLLDLNAPISALAGATSDALEFKRSFMPTTNQVYVGKQFLREEIHGSIGLGGVTTAAWLAVIPKFVPSDHRIAGILGSDLLKSMDVEIDIARSKLNLFSPIHCTGKVVYWTHTAPVAAVPMNARGMRSFVIPMQLDGKDIAVEISTKTSAQLNAGAARDIFHIAADKSEANAGHTFETLSVEGLTIRNPHISILEPNNGQCNGHPASDWAPSDTDPYSETVRIWGEGATRCFGHPDLVIGLPELRRLRVYIAYKDRMVYFTAADAN